ncbi:branched-chain amino acid transport system substrate-binding protein [Actinoplanes lutulentus]|uniref:Amino acid/amide ABC transporter substrate-binding protein (HAAT family) n=1 Tax=Actinoplanes lutulentus TaxID=1287878 RepID=A0A327ZJI4_9ACTN|nr:ABC transporter substrate-binding protein [Actinoplanes lutulentus]MBB2944363.1 branched-chain amino acid transport system substrate-binding protein [Actinoplanes lutulentus]RAK42405.1 amino acid/amide ABC transporter substrate-binding protein (HAAT family) [Actinoplanes lutulentus]
MRRAIVLVLAICLAGCGGAADSAGDDPIRIGQIVSLTGNYSPLGTENQKSVALAVDTINAAGGIGGRRIELTVRDDKSLPDQSVLAFNELKEDADAIIGSPFSNSALATIPLVDREEIPYLSLTPADEQINPIHPYVFVVPATSATYAEAALQYFQASKLTRVAVAFDTKSSYAVAGAKGLQAKAQQYGVTLGPIEEFQTTATEFSAIFTHVRASDAQALMFWGTGAPGVALTKQYAAQNLDIPLVLTGSQASKLFLDPAGPAADGVTIASSIGVVGSYLPAGDLKAAADELTTAFQQKYGYPPPQFAQDGYSGVKLLAAAVEKAGGTDRAKVRDALETLTLTTPNGTYTYSPTNHSGLTTDFISINTIEGGKFVPTEFAKARFQ